MRFTYSRNAEVESSIKSIHKALESVPSGQLPPHPVLGALLSFGEPDQVLSYKRSVDDAPPSGKWDVYALFPDGLVVVTAAAGKPDWVLDGKPTPRSAEVSAEWMPYSGVLSVDIAGVDDDLIDSDDTGAWEVAIDVQWAIQLVSGKTLHLDRVRLSASGLLAEEEFVRELRRRMTHG